MASKTLIAVDDIESARLAEAFLARLKSDPAEAMFKVLHVIEPIEAISNWPSEQYRIEARELVTEMCVRLRNHFPGANIESKVSEGYATESIIDEARNWGANLIVVGSHDRKGLVKLWEGSVSCEVVSHAPCSVMVIRKFKYSQEIGVTSKAL
ncbi:MAG: universal stress protein [Candidatus Obscuribacterales bacterium]|nr:universal stress protein [Candidatus Obscuribacterales bacterium]